MAEPKTKVHDGSVEEFLNSVPDEKKRQDSFVVLDLMRRVTGQEPKLWGPSIVGFGTYRYKYANGKELDWPLIGFSPRKQNLTLYVMPSFERFDELLGKLGKHSTGQSCLYIKRLADVDFGVLEDLVRQCVDVMRKTENGFAC